MDADGTKGGFDLPMLKAVRAAVTVPVIASGGAGAVGDFAPAVHAGADAVLAASVFHFRELTIGEVKAAMAAEDRGPMTALDPAIAARLKRNAEGLFTAVVQERGSGDVLMVAWMDDDALARTLATREATYFSRSRNEQWIKGATSGHTQRVHSVRLDCDGDAVLLEVDQVGGRATPATTAVSTPTFCWLPNRGHLAPAGTQPPPKRGVCPEEGSHAWCGDVRARRHPGRRPAGTEDRRADGRDHSRVGDLHLRL